MISSKWVHEGTTNTWNVEGKTDKKYSGNMRPNMRHMLNEPNANETAWKYSSNISVMVCTAHVGIALRWMHFERAIRSSYWILYTRGSHARCSCGLWDSAFLLIFFSALVRHYRIECLFLAIIRLFLLLLLVLLILCIHWNSSWERAMLFHRQCAIVWW